MSFSPLKRFCRWLVNHDLWESFIITAILISSITLAIDEPRLDQESTLKEALTVSNYFFTALFTLELLAKVFAYDLLVPPDENGENGGYLLSTWNLLVSHAAATQTIPH